MEAEGLDGLVATTSDNVYYFTECYYPGYGRGTFAVLGTENVSRPVLVIPTSHCDLALPSLAQLQDVICHTTFYREVMPGVTLDAEERDIKRISVDRPWQQGPLEGLAAAIEACHLGNRTIGVDEEGISHSFFLRLQELLSKATLRPVSNLIRRIRTIKTPKEVELLRRSVTSTEQAFLRALTVVRDGVTEREVSNEYYKALVDLECLPYTTYLEFGRRGGGQSNQPAGDTKLKRGDVIRFDGGCLYGGYPSDIIRTPVFGQPTQRIVQYYQALLAGQDHVESMIRPGVRASDLYREGMRVAIESGLTHYRRHGIGHGLGLGGYNPPLLTPTDDTVLEEGMVLCIELPYYELGSFNIGLEDEVVVTKDGYEMLSTLRRDLWLMG